MFRKTMTLMIAALLLLMSFSAAAAENGVFGEIAANDGGDERLAVLDEIADQLRVSAETDSFSIEISQAYYEGNCVYVAYRTNGCAVVQDGLDVEGGSYADNAAYLPRSGYEKDELFHDNETLKKELSELWIKVKLHE